MHTLEMYALMACDVQFFTYLLSIGYLYQLVSLLQSTVLQETANVQNCTSLMYRRTTFFADMKCWHYDISLNINYRSRLPAGRPHIRHTKI